MTQEHRSTKRTTTLVLLCASLAMVVMDNTIVNVALPVMSRSLHAGTSELQWIVDAYVLAMAPLLLVGGRIGDRFGHRLAWQAGLAIFAVASAGGAFATGLWLLVAARTVMGVGAALVMPATLALVADTYADGPERARAIAIWAATTGVGVVLGPVVGGFLLNHYWWGSIFLVNVIIALMLLASGPAMVRAPQHRSTVNFDWLSTMLSTAGVAGLVWSVIEAPTLGWTHPAIPTVALCSTAILVWFGRLELRRATPLLQLRLFLDGTIAGAAAAIGVAFFVLFGIVFLLTQYFQLIHLYSPLAAGVRTIPFAIAVMVAAGASQQLSKRFGRSTSVSVGLAALGLGAMALLFLDARTMYVLMLPSLLLLGAGVGLAMAPSSDAIMGGVPLSDMGMGAAINDVARELGGALGIAVIGSVAATVYTSRLGAQAAGHLQLSLRQGPSAGNAARAASAAFVSGLHVAAIVAAAIAAVALCASLGRAFSRGHSAEPVGAQPAEATS